MPTPSPTVLASLADITPEWIAERREIIHRDGYAVRAGRGTIEVKSLHTNEWLVLQLPHNARCFADDADRAAVLTQLIRP